MLIRLAVTWNCQTRVTNDAEPISGRDVNAIQHQTSFIDSRENTDTAPIDPRKLMRDLQAFRDPRPIRSGWELAITLIIPALILMKLSGPENLGALRALLLADAYKHTAEFLRVFLAVVGGNLHANQ